MNRRLVKRAKPIVTEDMRRRVLEVLSHDSFILGENTLQFERDFAEYCGAKHCVSVASGTSALHLTLLACGVHEGDEVITVPNSFFSTASSIIYTGARPVFVDVDPNTLNMNPNAVEEAITNRTKAIMPVHLYGHPADMDPIFEIAEERGLRVVEDAAEAHGARYKEKRVGSLNPKSNACFSFYPTKNITGCGDGGAVVTSDEEIAYKIVNSAITHANDFGATSQSFQWIKTNLASPTVGEAYWHPGALRAFKEAGLKIGQRTP